MPYVNVPIPWTEQPHGTEGIDWGNPLTQGLRDLTSLGSAQRRNVARNNFLLSNGTVNSDSRGPIITTDATAYSVLDGYAVLPITVIVGFVWLGAPTNGAHALWVSHDTLYGQDGLYLRYQDAGTLEVLKSQVALIGSGSFTVKPEGSLLGVTIDAGNYALYGDGALIGSGTHAQTFTSGTPVLGSEGSDPTLSGHPNGIFYFQAVWDRVLSADEIKRISANPWQLHLDEEFPVWFGAAAGVSGTLAAALAAFTSSITGNTTIVGSMAQTAANAVSAFTGSTTVTGTIAKTLGNDVAAFTGNTAITGTIAKTLTNDVGDLQGSAGAGTSGTIAVTTQNNAPNMTGTTSIVGTMNASTENATSNATGSTTILGQMAASVSNFISGMYGSSGVQSLVNRLLTLLGVGS